MVLTNNITIQLGTFARQHRTYNMTTIEDVITYTKSILKFAQADFSKSPTSVRWNMCMRAMFVYQQADFASRSATVDRKQLLADLDNKPYGAWEDIISKATTGKTVRENVQEFAVI